MNLEGPEHPDDLYLGRGDDVELVAQRPRFTGDVLQLTDGTTVSLLQHPCSMRTGLVLVPQLIVGNVTEWPGRPPSDWKKHIKRMFLPEFSTETAKVIEFTQVRTIAAHQVESATRTAILSQNGVNLLLQRWVHHLTRVVVPTGTLHEAIAAEHEEADLIGEVVGDLVDRGHDPNDAAKLVDDWLNENENGTRRRALLRDPQARSNLRRKLRRTATGWDPAGG